MNKAELIEALSEHFDGNKAAAGRALTTVLNSISGAVAAGDRVSLIGFGTFERAHRAARTVRNPATGGTVQVQETFVARFRPGASLKTQVAGGSSAKSAAKASAPAKKAKKAAKSPAKVAKSSAKADVVVSSKKSKDVKAKAVKKDKKDQKAKKDKKSKKK